MEFVTQNETLVTQIAASSPSPNFHTGKSCVKKITNIIIISVYFLAICANFPFKIEKFELEVAEVSILGQDFAFRAAINISSQLKE